MPIQIDPNIDWKAQGAYGGVLAGLQSAQVQREQEQNLEQSRLANLYQGLQNDRYAQMTPSEVQQSQGLGLQQQAKGRVLDETAQAQIDEQLAKYAAGKSQGELQKDLIGIQSQLVQLQQAKNAYVNAHPGQKLQIAQQLASQFGIDPNSPQFQQIMQAGPEKLMDSYIGTYENILSRAPDVLGKLQTIDRTGEWDMKKAQLMANAQLGSASIHANAAQKGQASFDNKARAKLLASPENVLYPAAYSAVETGLDPISGEPLTEAELNMWKSKRDAAAATIEMKSRQRPEVDIPGVERKEPARLNPKREQSSGGLEAAIQAELERRAKQGK